MRGPTAASTLCLIGRVVSALKPVIEGAGAREHEHRAHLSFERLRQPHPSEPSRMVLFYTSTLAALPFLLSALL